MNTSRGGTQGRKDETMNAMTGDQFGRIPEGMKWCPHCNGYGSSLKEGSARCTHCGGSGLVWADRGRPVVGRNGEPPAPR
jgi:DnaJ-class molecular chaperone